MLSFECIKNEKSVYFLLTSATFTTAFSAKSVVGNAISFIQKQRPLLFSLLAHSRHSKQSSFPAENIKTTGKIHLALFVSFLGAKIGVNIPF